MQSYKLNESIHAKIASLADKWTLKILGIKKSPNSPKVCFLLILCICYCPEETVLQLYSFRDSGWWKPPHLECFLMWQGVGDFKTFTQSWQKSVLLNILIPMGVCIHRQLQDGRKLHFYQIPIRKTTVLGDVCNDCQNLSLG